MFTNIFQAPSVPTAMHTQRYYSSPPQLKNGPHQLVISSDKDGPSLSLDFVQYIPSSQEVSPAALLGNSSASGTSASRAGTIAAGVIGGVAFLTVIVLLSFLIRHRHHPNSIEDGDNNDNVDKSVLHITPFDYSGPPVAWSSKSKNTNLATTRPKRLSVESMQPPEYSEAIKEHLLFPLPNVGGRRRSSSDPHIYHARVS
jgi:hypothetical protein